jgi:hypothetical protein
MMSDCKSAASARSAAGPCALWLRGQHQATDFAVWMSLGVDVDVPIACRKLAALLWCQSCLPGYRTFHRTALFGQPTSPGAFLPD